jgi:hypothetical protein
MINSAPTFYGNEATTKSIQMATTNSKDYENAKSALEAHFFKILEVHPNLGHLASFVTVRDTVQRRRFFVVLEGLPNEDMRKVLNACMVWFALNLRKKSHAHLDPSTMDAKTDADSRHQPNSLQTICKQLFSTFASNGVNIRLGSLKSMTGSVHAYFKAMFAEVVKERPDFGRKPFQAGVDHNDEYKIRHFAKPPYRPEEIFVDLLDLIVHKILKIFMLRGMEEVSVAAVFHCTLFLLFLTAAISFLSLLHYRLLTFDFIPRIRDPMPVVSA